MIKRGAMKATPQKTIRFTVDAKQAKFHVSAIEFQHASRHARLFRFRRNPLARSCLSHVASNIATSDEARKIGENTMRLWAQLLIAAILAAAVPVANAQVPSPAPSPSQPSQNIPDQKLDATAAA